MANLNLCQFIGNIGADPEIRLFDGGGKIATARIAVTERFTDRNNNQQERTEWIPLVFNGKLSDIVEKFVHKGSTIYVQGKWHNREWQDQQGNKRQSTELTALALQLLDKREQDQARPAYPPAQPAYPPQAPVAPPQQQYQPPMPPQAPVPPAQPQYRAPQPPAPPVQPQYQQPMPPQPGQPGNTAYPPMNDPAYTTPQVDDLPPGF